MDLDVQLPSEYYAEGMSDRKVYEDRAKLIAKLTVPYLIREDSDTGTTQMQDSNDQSYGGQLVNTLKAKMGMALLPPSTSSFRLTPDSEELEALTGGDEGNRAKTHALISTSTTRINAELEVQQIRNSLFDLASQMIVVGSVIAEKKKKKGILVHTIQSYVVTLDSMGFPIKMCIVETLNILPEGVVAKEVKEEYELYTMCIMDTETETWSIVQEIEQELVGEEQKYKNYDKLPFRYLGWVWMKGDTYHRPYAEDYYKDLEQLDKLAKLLTDGSLIAAKTLLFVNQRGGRTRKDDVAESANGDVLDGSAEDVTTMKTEKNFDFQMPAEREAKIQKRLSAAFLMNESVTRDAERVTAQEIQFMAQELETSSLSGIYSKLSLQWSKWIVEQIMDELKIKFDAISVEVITGLDALGRSQQQQALDGFLERLNALGLSAYVKDSEVVARYAAFAGIDVSGLINTPEEVAKAQQQAQQQQAQMAGADAMAASAGQAVGEQVVQPQQ